MSQSINFPSDVIEEINQLSSQINLSPAEILRISFEYFVQTGSMPAMAEGMHRFKAEKVELTDSSDLVIDYLENDEQLSLRFHPDAFDEFDDLTEELQDDVIEEFMDRIFHEAQPEELYEDEDCGINLVLDKTEEEGLMLSRFDFGDIVYSVNNQSEIIIYSFSYEDFDALCESYKNLDDGTEEEDEAEIEEDDEELDEYEDEENESENSEKTHLEDETSTLS